MPAKGVNKQQQAAESFVQKLIVLIALLIQPLTELHEAYLSIRYLSEALKNKIKFFILRNYKILKLRAQLDEIKCYEEYERLGLKLDALQGKEAWKEKKESALYDWRSIEVRLNTMQSLRERKDIEGLVRCLRQDLQKNIGGICDVALYNQCRVGTKHLIEDYHNEIIKCIQFIYYYSGQKLTLSKKIEFFAETRHSFGRTALFLSGGATLGKYHFGVLKALYEADLMPRIIAGSSVGALIASGVATMKYSELWKAFIPEYGMIDAKFLKHESTSLLDALMRLKNGKPILSTQQLKDSVRDMTGDMTFLEVYEQNKWNLNITVTVGSNQGESRLLNYLTAPNVVVWSAVLASCAIPLAFDPVELMIKTETGDIIPYYTSTFKSKRKQHNFKFVDGSVACDLPMSRMSELFNINTFIVSQVNPHVAPFINSDGYSQGQSRIRRSLLVKMKTFLGNAVRHWIQQLTLLGLFPQYIKGITDLVLQTYRGHVTLAPRPTLFDYKILIGDIPRSDVPRALQQTYSLTVQRISHIRSFYGVEREFDRYYMRLKQKMHIQMHLRHDKDLIKYSIVQALERHNQSRKESKKQAKLFVRSPKNKEGNSPGFKPSASTGQLHLAANLVRTRSNQVQMKADMSQGFEDNSDHDQQLRPTSQFSQPWYGQQSHQERGDARQSFHTNFTKPLRRENPIKEGARSIADIISQDSQTQQYSASSEFGEQSRYPSRGKLTKPKFEEDSDSDDSEQRELFIQHKKMMLLKASENDDDYGSDIDLEFNEEDMDRSKKKILRSMDQFDAEEYQEDMI